MPTDDGSITKERALSAQNRFANWAVVERYLRPDLIFYKNDFLFIYPPGYQDDLLPLINQKKARGFQVVELTTAQTGNTCDGIRTAIRDWYNSKPATRDKFALLVGDVDQIPLCIGPHSTPTDDMYASTDGVDLDEEVLRLRC